ncbi:FAD-dependent oxidoreductase [Brevundimonas diminuta]|uniref:FAD-dependent oxidoreductase n=1 Tax=Brevundimonas diminuta TaxID=293 RepID=UPI003D9A2763
MSLSEEEFLEWVALAEHPTHANLFFLGAADRRITFYSQQVRALRLAHALSRLNRLHPHERIAVIGAGAAGCSAALALVSLGCRVEVFEQSEYPLALQRGSPRLLHPNIYDWPEPGALDAGANLPLLSWARNTGGAVSAAISGEINRAATPGDRQVIINRGISVKGLKRVGACWEISLGQGRGGEEFEKVILAAGFGDESLVGEATAEDYWTTAGVPAAAAERGRKLYFLSGSGDGGLTDLLGLLIDDFDHPGFTEWFLGLVPARDLSGAARAAQLHAEARGGEELTSALAEYLGPVLNRRGVPNALTRRLRPDRTVVFNTEEPSTR